MSVWFSRRSPEGHSDVVALPVRIRCVLRVALPGVNGGAMIVAAEGLCPLKC